MPLRHDRDDERDRGIPRAASPGNRGPRLSSRLVKSFLLCLAVGVLVVGCGQATETASAEQAWCAFADASEQSALKFDVIFEAGLSLGLDMDVVNARAAGLNGEYRASGMTEDEAARAVSDDLFEMDDFVAACGEAFVTCAERLLSAEADEICPAETE